MDGNIPPFTRASRSLITANGKTYDLGSTEDRSRMEDDAFVYFIDQVRAAIRQVDPTALVGIGFFAPQAPHAWRVGDMRLIATQGVLARSTADFRFPSISRRGTHAAAVHGELWSRPAAGEGALDE